MRLGVQLTFGSYDPPAFHGPSTTHRTVEKVNCYATSQRFSRDKPIPYAVRDVKKKRELFPGLPLASPVSNCVTAQHLELLLEF